MHLRSHSMDMSKRDFMNMSPNMLLHPTSRRVASLLPRRG
jgi:hypothetical protein